MGIDRDLLEAVPVVRFGLRPVILDRSLVVVMSALPLDVFQADAVIAVNTGESGLEDMLDVFDLLPVESLSTERLMSGAGRADAPALLLMNAAGAPSLELDDFEPTQVDLDSGQGISPAINALLDRVVRPLASGTRWARACPTIVLHATHRASGPADLQPATFPIPGARLAVRISLHEPFGDDWSCNFTGSVDAVLGPHIVAGTIEPAGPVTDELEGTWRVEMFREREIWMLRSMER